MDKQINKKKIIDIAICIIVSFIIWVIIINNVNPYVDESISVPVFLVLSQEARLNSKSYNIENNDEVIINYKVRQDDANKINNRSVKLTVNVDENTKSGYIKPDINFLDSAKGIMHNITMSPEKVYLNASDTTNKIFPVLYTIEGELSSNDLLVGYVTLNPNQVNISGSIEDIAKIDRVGIDINVSGKANTFSDTVSLICYDKDGQIIQNKNLSIDTDTIEYKTVIYATKTVNVNANIIGNVAKGYSYAGTIITPNNITISGPREVVNNITSIELPQMDITNMDTNYETVLSISDLVPQNTRNVSNSTFIRVVVAINGIVNDTEDEEESKTSGTQIIVGPKENRETREGREPIDHIEQIEPTESSTEVKGK